MIESTATGHYQGVEPGSSGIFVTDRVEAGPGDLAADLRGPASTEQEAAWRSLYDREFDRVYRLVCRLGAEPGEVEDLVQRAFLTAFQRLDAVAAVHDPGAWLRGIVVKVVAQHRRWRRVREAKRWLLGDLRVAAPAPVIPPDAGANAAREVERCRAVLDGMGRKLRDVLVLCDLEQCTPKEVSEILGIPVNTVRSRHRLARDRFTAIWRKEYGER